MKYIANYELKQQYPGDAGYDLQAADDAIIFPDHPQPVGTGCKIALEVGEVGIVKARSGLSFHSHLETGAGVIDSNYRGEVKVKLINTSLEPVHIKKGDRIAQLIIFKHESPIPVKVEAFEDDTVRGERGFGSTG